MPYASSTGIQQIFNNSKEKTQLQTCPLYHMVLPSCQNKYGCNVPFLPNTKIHQYSVKEEYLRCSYLNLKVNQRTTLQKLSHNTSQNFVLLLIGLALFTEKSFIQLILFTFLIQITCTSSCGTTSKTYEATQQECRSEQQFICKYLNWEDINCVQKVKRLENIFFKGSSLQQCTSKVLINSWMQILKHHKKQT